MASMTVCGTWVPPGPSRKIGAWPVRVCCRAGNWRRNSGNFWNSAGKDCLSLMVVIPSFVLLSPRPIPPRQRPHYAAATQEGVNGRLFTLRRNQIGPKRVQQRLEKRNRASLLRTHYAQPARHQPVRQCHLAGAEDEEQGKRPEACRCFHVEPDEPKHHDDAGNGI